jgi:outer membrane protein OmpA-like peptidoglycan-associated protein
MVSVKAPMKIWVFRGVLAASAISTVACGGSTAFGGKVQVAGDLPAPPPPPPKKADPPPAPKKKVKVSEEKLEIDEKIQFQVAQAVILPESFPLLDEIAQTIKENPDIKKLAIDGHASAEGDKKANLKLSDDRAKAVMKYLVDKGIDAKLLEAKGYGSEKPLADNDTDEGREKNRRVEFNIVERASKPKAKKKK